LSLPSRIKDKLFYGWIIVLVFLIVGTTLWGIRFSFGVFFKSIAGEFNLSRATTSAIPSAYMVLSGVFVILGGWALDRYGPRIVVLLMGLATGFSLLLTSQADSVWQLFMAYSLLLSIGSSAIYVVIMSTVSRWFDKKRGMALGIACSGAGLGTVVMAPLATYLIVSFDWRMAYIILGIIAWLIVIPLSRPLKKGPYEIGTLPDGVTTPSGNINNNEEDNLHLVGFSLPRALRTRSFWLLMFSGLLFASNLLLILTHLVPHATDIGISVVEAATVLSLIGGTAAAGSILIGTISDRIGKKVSAIICTLLQAGALLWLVWAQDLWMFYLFAVVYGFAYGGFGPSIAAIVSKIFGLDKIGAILGVLDVGFGIGAAVGPYIGGLIFDVSHSYFMAFLIGTATMLLATLLIALVQQEMIGDFSVGDHQGHISPTARYSG